MRDTTDTASRWREKMMLLVGKRATVYKSYDYRLATLDAKRQIQEQVTANGPAGGRIMVKRNDHNTATEYYFFAVENKFVRREKLIPINSYLIEEPVPAINWHITTDTASFSGYHCQKATCHFKGRDYSAWFCPDISIHSGPWKLLGLPGLILQASDARKQVVFAFDGFEDVSKTKPQANAEPSTGPVLRFLGKDVDADPTLIAFSQDGINTTPEQFEKLKEARQKDPVAFMLAARAAAGEHVDQNGPPRRVTMQGPPPPVINNPIELPEKK